ncbi:hypothetical protein [Kitasatospora terrestris]
MADALRGLRRLLPAGKPAAAAGLLPPGRPVRPDDHEEGAQPVLRLSDGPAPRGLWEQLHRLHPQTGLWPLLPAPLSRTCGSAWSRRRPVVPLVGLSFRHDHTGEWFSLVKGGSGAGGHLE